MKVAEGDWHSVQIANGVWAAGCVSRVGLPDLLMHFFGPWSHQPSLADIEGLTATDATLVSLGSDVAVTEGRWPLIGRRSWNRDEWPVPVFRRVDPLLGHVSQVVLDESLNEQRLVRGERHQLREAIPHASAGHLFLERRLGVMMCPPDSWRPQEGDLYVIEHDGEFHSGRVARADYLHGRTVVYSFPVSTDRPTFDELDGRTTVDAQQVCLVPLDAFGPANSLARRAARTWSRKDWPLPTFGSVTLDWGFAIEFDDDDLDYAVRWEEIPADEAKLLPSVKITRLWPYSPPAEPLVAAPASRATTVKKPRRRSTPGVEQAVLVRLGTTDLENVELDEVEDALRDAVAGSPLGNFDGREMGATDAVLFLYGADAAALWVLVDATLRRCGLRSGRIIVRFGGPGAPQVETSLRGA